MDAKKFGVFLAQIRKEKKMTQAQLAEKINVTDKAVSRWERGLGFPDITTLEPLADALGVSLLELMRGEKSADEIPKEQYSKEEVSELLQTAGQMRKEQGVQDQHANWMAGIVLVAVAAVFFFTGHASFMGALFAGAIGAGVCISAYYFWKNKEDAESRKIYGSLFGGLFLLFLYLCSWLVPDTMGSMRERFLSTCICYFWMIVIMIAALRCIRSYMKEKRTVNLVFGILGLVFLFGVLWYYGEMSARILNGVTAQSMIEVIRI